VWGNGKSYKLDFAALRVLEEASLQANSSDIHPEKIALVDQMTITPSARKQ
jgi:hypothetical protein